MFYIYNSSSIRLQQSSKLEHWSDEYFYSWSFWRDPYFAHLIMSQQGKNASFLRKPGCVPRPVAERRGTGILQTEDTKLESQSIQETLPTSIIESQADYGLRQMPFEDTLAVCSGMESSSSRKRTLI